MVRETGVGKNRYRKVPRSLERAGPSGVKRSASDSPAGNAQGRCKLPKKERSATLRRLLWVSITTLRAELSVVGEGLRGHIPGGGLPPLWKKTVSPVGGKSAFPVRHSLDFFCCNLSSPGPVLMEARGLIYPMFLR